MNPTPNDNSVSPPNRETPIVLACPACGHLLRIAYQFLGVKGNCVSCQTEIMGAETAPGKFEAVYTKKPLDEKTAAPDAEVVAPQKAPEEPPAPGKTGFGGLGGPVADPVKEPKVTPVETPEEEIAPPAATETPAATEAFDPPPSFLPENPGFAAPSKIEDPIEPSAKAPAQSLWGFSEAVTKTGEPESEAESDSSPFAASNTSQLQKNQFVAPASNPAPPEPADKAPPEFKPPAKPQSEDLFPVGEDESPLNPRKPKQEIPERPAFVPVGGSVGTAIGQASPFSSPVDSEPDPFSVEEPEPEPEPVTSFPQDVQEEDAAPPSFQPERFEAAPPPSSQPVAENPFGRPPGGEAKAAPANQFSSPAPVEESPVPEMKSPFEEKPPVEEDTESLRSFLTSEPAPAVISDPPSFEPSAPSPSAVAEPVTPVPDPITFSNIKLKSATRPQRRLGTVGMLVVLFVFSLLGGFAAYIWTPTAKKAEFKAQLTEWLAPGAVVIEKLPFGIGKNFTAPDATPEPMEINPSAKALPITPETKSTASSTLPVYD
ncbi:MAG: hypothetical protein P1U89_12120 [Verrucomicrobiales bacterium]|nr:hypothetical protein [Verrucomicrobiales bacterium]